MKIAIIGLGYVGLISAVIFSEQGHEVYGIDMDGDKIVSIRDGKVPFFEPGLTSELLQNIHHVSSDYFAIPADVDIVMMAVGTPPSPIDNSTDLSALKGAARQLAHRFKDLPQPLYVIKSTVPPGTSEIIANILDCGIVSNPEFLREGHALEDARKPDRTVLGFEGWIPLTLENKMMELYRGQNVIVVSNETAELAKYAANAFLALKVSYINEIADLCEKVGANVDDVAHIMGTDDRIGSKFLKAGPGYGGSCFPKDVFSLIRTARDVNSPLSIVESLASMNEERKIRMARFTISHLLDGKDRVLFYGLTFKEGTDDMRGAASLTIIPLVLRNTKNVSVYEPHDQHARQCPEFSGLKFITKEEMAGEHFDIVVMMNPPTDPDFKYGESVFGELVIDLRNCLDPKLVEKATSVYMGIGKCD